MKLSETMEKVRDAITVTKVFAEPYEADGVTVIPAAAVSGGAGGGSGTDDKGQPGEGGGFGVSARPVGAYVIAHGRVRWRPAVDLNRAITMGGLVLIACLLRRRRVRPTPSSAER